MNEQIANILTILASLLTGGFLMVFIENQQISQKIANRYHQKMLPFFHCFTNYVKFVAVIRTFYKWNKSSSGYMNNLKDNVCEIARYGSLAIISGQNFSPNYFSVKEIEEICEKINNIWYLVDKDRSKFNNDIFFYDERIKNNDIVFEYLANTNLKYGKNNLERIFYLTFLVTFIQININL